MFTNHIITPWLHSAPLEVGSVFSEQYGSRQKRADLFQQSAKSGQSDIYGNTEIAVPEKSVCILSGSRAKGGNHSSGWNWTGDYCFDVHTRVYLRRR